MHEIKVCVGHFNGSFVSTFASSRTLIVEVNDAILDRLSLAHLCNLFFVDRPRKLLS